MPDIYLRAPLIWKNNESGINSAARVADTIYGELYVDRIGKQWKWFLGYGDTGGDCGSPEEGEKLGSEWYESAIAPALVSVGLGSHIIERLNQHSDNLAIWESGFLYPTEPDEDERSAVIRELRAAIAELTIIRQIISGERAL